MSLLNITRVNIPKKTYHRNCEQPKNGVYTMRYTKFSRRQKKRLMAEDVRYYSDYMACDHDCNEL